MQQRLGQLTARLAAHYVPQPQPADAALEANATKRDETVESLTAARATLDELTDHRRELSSSTASLLISVGQLDPTDRDARIVITDAAVQSADDEVRRLEAALGELDAQARALRVEARVQHHAAADARIREIVKGLAPHFDAIEEGAGAIDAIRSRSQMPVWPLIPAFVAGYCGRFRIEAAHFLGDE